MTCVTPSMCRPREATSVATRIGSVARLEVAQHAQAHALVQVAGDARAAWKPLSARRCVEPLGLALGVDEDQRALRLLALQEAEQQRQLLVPADVVEHVLDVLGGDLLRRRPTTLIGSFMCS